MRIFLFLLLSCLIVVTGFAEIRSSSRNLKPLTQRTDVSTTDTAGVNNTEKNTLSSLKTGNVPDTVTKVSFFGPTNGWGFVKTASPYYSLTGKRLGIVPGGTLFKYAGVKETSKNPVLVSTVKWNDGWKGPCLLDCTKTAAYVGDLDTVNPETVKDLTAYFMLNGKIADRKEALAQAAFAANPYLETARHAQEAYQESIAKADEMEKQMNTLTGTRKAKADEMLRAFKYAQVRVKAKADQEAARYKAWKDAHPINSADLAADTQLQALERERQSAAEKVRDLLPPDEKK